MICKIIDTLTRERDKAAKLAAGNLIKPNLDAYMTAQQAVEDHLRSCPRCNRGGTRYQASGIGGG